MTNKELFKKLSHKQQMELVSILVAYDSAHIEYYNGEYHITTNWSLLKSYPDDFKVLNEFTQNEFYQDIEFDYFTEWYNFVDEKRSKGEKNINGKWQLEFESICKPFYEKALQNYLEA